jgi:type II secretory ATPase GspE/PulE/Tfp pilus assembly ATPase PilB-like protein
MKTEPFSVVSVFDTILETALEERVSDVHLSTQKDGLVIRFRVDGVMETVTTVNRIYQDELIARIKVLAELRTDEHFIAQDGRFSFQSQNHNGVEVRVSIVPIHQGPNCVLRILRSDAAIELSALGLPKTDLLQVERAIHNPYGLIIATGPTGSGKTTTLYGLLNEINTPTRTVITIEDPIEYILPGANQIAVNNQVGLNFANGLRSIVRQDPDVIMVGEVRDGETAKLATTAALTGHIVLTTLHTNDAPSALTRLVEMGVEPYLVASTVSVVIAQRLVRRLCPVCKERVMLSQAESHRLLDLSPLIVLPSSVYVATGCSECRGVGYRGRTALYEVCTVTSELRDMLLNRQSAFMLRQVAEKCGMGSLLASGIALVSAGETSVGEVLAAVYE